VDLTNENPEPAAKKPRTTNEEPPAISDYGKIGIYFYRSMVVDRIQAKLRELDQAYTRMDEEQEKVIHAELATMFAQLTPR
jgi:hypothetical protein